MLGENATRIGGGEDPHQMAVPGHQALPICSAEFVEGMRFMPQTGARCVPCCADLFRHVDPDPAVPVSS